MKKKILALCLVVVLAVTAVTGVTLAYFTDVTETKTNVFTAGKVDIDLTEPSWDPEKNGSNLMPGASFPKDPTITVEDDSEDCYVFLDVTLNKYKSLGPTMAKHALAEEKITQEQFNSYCVVEGEKTVFKTSLFLRDLMKPENMETLREILNFWFIDINHPDWKVMDYGYDCARDDIKEDGDWLTVRLAYIGGATNGGDAVLSAGDSVRFMNAFTMPSDVTEDMLDHNLTENMFYEGNFIIDFTAYAIQAQEFEDGGVDVAYAAYFAQND